MEKKILKYFIILIIFFLGLSLGISYHESNRPQQVQDDLEDFEDKITTPNNQYGQDFTPVDPTQKNKKNETKNEYGIRDNAFTTLGKDGEQVIKKIIDGIVNSSGDLFRSIFKK